MSYFASLIGNLIEAKRERDKCYESCDTSPSYFCYEKQAVVDRIEREIETEIREIVRSELDAAGVLNR